MNVPNITQGSGSAATLPRAFAGGQIMAPNASAAAPAPVRTHTPEPGISLTRLACFDINGDGHIDPRSADEGGDATLLVPTHEVDLPTWSYTVDTVDDPQPVKTKPTGNGEHTVVPAPANAARTNRAVGAYQRYGQTATPPVPAPAVPAPASAAGTAVAPATPAPVAPAVVATAAAVPANAVPGSSVNSNAAVAAA